MISENLHKESGGGLQVGLSLYKAAGELGMPVGVMAFGGLPAQLPAIKALLKHSPSTKLIVDHVRPP